MRIGSRAGLLGLFACGGALGCNSFDEPVPPGSDGPRLVIPVDERPVQAAPVKPTAVSGGTLSVVANGLYAVVADPERDTVAIVDLPTSSLRHTIVLEPGDEPGRSAESADGVVHVALRRGGAVVAIDPASGAVRERRAVCKSPRGIAFDVATKLLHVACAEGKLVSLPADGGEAVRTLALDADLRDVIVRGDELWVTRFKSAEILRVTSAGELGSRVVLPNGQGTIAQPLPGDEAFAGPEIRTVNVQAGVAWRAVPTASGGAVMVHQQAVLDDVDISEPSASGSSYGGGGFDCNGIVKNVVTSFLPGGTFVSAPFMGAPMPVDVAVSADQQWVAVAHAGPADFQAPRPFVVFPDEDGEVGGAPTPVGGFGPGGAAVSVMPLQGLSEGCTFPDATLIEEPVVAVAFAPDGRLLAQTREPSQLMIVNEVPWGASTAISLGGETRADTGHDLFHRDSGGGIACASCHPEAGEDGHVWRFSDVGARRTQALHVGLRGTAPFHWNGDLKDVGTLMTEVFVGRMGGARQSSERLSALSEWLFSVEPPPAMRDSSDEAAVRGQALFESAAVGCVTCHSGEKLTNNQSVAVATQAGSPKLQVPSLVAIAYRAPFMHDGCAATLAARFDPACGGDAHGNTGQLSAEQLGDLVAYLESL